jgi:SAM-dependent methyltransferase
MSDDLTRAVDAAIDSLTTTRAYHQRSRDRYVRTVRLVLEQIDDRREMRIAEIGPGPIVVALRRMFQCETTAIGLLKGRWRSELEQEGIGTVIWDLTEPLPPEDHEGSYDVVVLCEVIEHLNRWPIEVLTDVKKLLKSNGLLVLSTVNMVRLVNRLRVMGGQSPLRNPFERTEDGINHVREYTLAEMTYYLERAGFVPIKAERWSCYESSVTGKLARCIGALFPNMANYFAIVARKDERHGTRSRTRYLGR